MGYYSTDLNVQLEVAALAHDLRYNCHVTDTDSFLSKVLPVPGKEISTIYGTLVAQGHYDESKRQWLGHDLANQREPFRGDFCDLFVHRAEAIRLACQTLRECGNDYVDGSWVTRADASLRTSSDGDSNDHDNGDDRGISKLPDVVNVSRTEGHCEWNERIARPSEQSESRKKSKGATVDTTKEDGKDATIKLKNELRLWWLPVHTVVEVKETSRIEDWLESIEKVFGYMRMILREQRDRRFVVGLVICADQVTVWRCDRSGLVGTAKSINIQKEPEDFIQVISAFSLLDAHQLGWDTSMKLYIPVSNEFRPSYTYLFNLKDLQANVHNTHWAIEMPALSDATDGRPERRELFITVRVLSAIGAELVCGRAIIVWEVIRYSELSNPSKVLILKQYWRPNTPGTATATNASSSMPPEASFYNTVDERRIYSFEDVKVAGSVDSTLEFIRIDSAVSGLHERDNFVSIREKRHREEYEDPFLNSSMQDEYQRVRMTTAQAAEPLIPRTHTRILMDTWGWPVKFFKDIVELLSVIRDAIEEHQVWYHKGILHRDISIGNILICPVVEDNVIQANRTRGHLIDLDHAEQSTELQKTPSLVQKWTKEKVARKIADLKDEEDLDVDEQVVRMTLERIPQGMAMQYIKDAITAIPGLPEGKVYTTTDLGWDTQIVEKPTFEDRIARRGRRTGTVPFMSCEVLKKGVGPFYSGKPPQFFHDAVHDLESFLWVVVYLCTTRGGPGGVLRKELQPESDGDPEVKELRRALADLFEGDETALLEFKEILLRVDDTFSESVSPHFHPFFEDLIPMVNEWWGLLRMAYRYRAYEYEHIHVRVLYIMGKTLKMIQAKSTLGTLPIRPDQATVNENTRRVKDIHRVMNAFRVDMNPPATPQAHAPSLWNADPRPSAAREFDQPQLSPAPKGPMKQELHLDSLDTK